MLYERSGDLQCRSNSHWQLLSEALSSFAPPNWVESSSKRRPSVRAYEREEIDQVIMGNVLPFGLGQNPARQAMIRAGLPMSGGALTVNKVCGSGLKAVMLGTQAIMAGDADIIVAGGMESMSRAPYYLENARTGYRLWDGKLVDGMVHDGLWDVVNNYHMGFTAEISGGEVQDQPRGAGSIRLLSRIPGHMTPSGTEGLKRKSSPSDSCKERGILPC